MDKYQLHRILLDNPSWERALREAIEAEEKGEARIEENNNKYPDKPDLFRYLGWEWYEVHTPVATLNKMVANGVLDITHNSRSSTHYMLNNREATKEALEMLDAGVESQVEEEDQVPDDLFSQIVSHDNIKRVLTRSINSQTPTHVLLYGPPATAKSLFLAELSRLPESKLVLGSSISKAGLVEYLLDYKPRFLIIDELEKAAGEDLSTLLSLMETGMITRMKFKKRETEYLKTWVFGSANKITNLPQELKSRFLPFEVKPYDIKQLKQISRNILNGYHSKEIIDYIVDKVSQYSKDIRDVKKVANLSNNKQDIDYFVKEIWG